MGRTKRHLTSQCFEKQRDSRILRAPAGDPLGFVACLGRNNRGCSRLLPTLRRLRMGAFLLLA
jgi:hypothetical protein